MVIRRPPSKCLCHGTCAAEKRGYVHDLDHNVIGLKRSLVGKGSSVREMKTTLSVPFSDPRFHFPPSPSGSILAFLSSPRFYFQSLPSFPRHQLCTAACPRLLHVAPIFANRSQIMWVSLRETSYCTHWDLVFCSSWDDIVRIRVCFCVLQLPHLQHLPLLVCSLSHRLPSFPRPNVAVHHR